MVAASDRRTIIMWATPRSVSTAFEKAVSQSTDVDILHEPYTHSYYFGPRRRSARYGDAQVHADEHPLAAMRASGAPVLFVKELAFQAEPFVEDDIFREVHHCFMLRHPKLVIQSLLPLKPDFTEHELGFVALHRMLDRIRCYQRDVPVVDGTLFRQQPEAVLRCFCKHVGLEYSPSMLTWEDGRLRTWRDDEAESQAKWHKTLERSHGVIPPDPTAQEFSVPPGLSEMYNCALLIYAELTTRMHS